MKHPFSLLPMDALPLSPSSSSRPPPAPLSSLTMDDASQGKAKEIVGREEEVEEEEEEASASASASAVAVEEEEGEQHKRQFRKKSFIRADLVNLADLDAALADWHLKRGGGSGGVGGVFLKAEEGGGSNRREEWEIDTSKLVVKDRLATGTFGTVYRGIFQGQDVAVKLLDWGDESSRTRAEIEALRNSFQQEVAVWHKLDHLNVTRFVGASMGGSAIRIPSKGKEFDFLPVASKVCCVVVEYLPGGTLKSFLIRHRRRKLAFKVVMQIALDLSRGLSYLHSKNIVHRDVKTENMLLDINMRVKIADFGVARVEAQNPQDMTGETGTLGYMAPEVFRGEAYDRTCDVYSFGICLWETYCCDMPYADLSFAEMTSAVVNKNLRPTIPKCCPSSLASVMKKCWDANPKNRPDMDKVVQMLEAIDTTKGGGMIPPDQPQGCLCFLRYRGP